MSRDEEYQMHGFTSLEDSNIQSCIRNRSGVSVTSSEREKKSTACCLRKRHRKHRTEIKDTRKTRGTCRKDRARTRRNAPLLSDQKTSGSSRCSKPSSKDQDKFSSTPERVSRPQQVTSDLWDCPQDVSHLRLQKLEVDFPSTFESRSLISAGVEPNSDSEFAYIYAESIKGCDSTCCTTPGDCNTHNPLVKTDTSTERDPESVRNSFEEESEDSDCNLYMFACSIAATAGSRLNADCFGSSLDDFDSTCIYTDRERRPGSRETEQGYSPAEVEWSCESSCYTADCDSYCTTDRQTSSSDSDGCCLEALGHIKCPEVFLPGFEGCFDCGDAAEDVCRGPETFCSRRDTGELCGVVTQTDRRHFSEIFCEVIKEVTQEKDTEKMNVNEGFLFHPKQFLQVKNSEYREGREYSFLRHIQNGSYGDVFSIRDKQTGFTCAAKKIPLCSFRWEEVETWSRMESPRVLQLYGAVREGLNVILFMDLKTGSLAQLLRVKGRLSEELALCYHYQVLQALQHLHSRRVVHLDVKVDNVLLSEDGRECFLCDFGLSETLNQGGYSTKTFRGNILRGTESHMPPEVARGDPRSAKADIWSSCCMLLHMLNGHQPWTRYYPHPLYLKIVSEPPPLWEIPPDCDPLTCDVIKGGLVKEPRERHSASELLQKTVKALRKVCGLSGSEEPSKQYSASVPEDCPDVNLHETPVPSTVETPAKTRPPSFPEDLSAPTIHWVSTWRQTAPNEDDSDSTTEENEWDEDAENNKLKRDKMSSWMDRYWGEEENNEKQICSEDDSELESDEDSSQINENLNATDQTDAEESKTDYYTDKRVVFGGCGEFDRSLLEETESWDGEIRSVVDDEEVESDLESLRELGSDGAQEWEPFLQLQTRYLPKEAQLQSEDSYSESEEESVMLRKSEQKGTSLPDSHGPQPFTCTIRCDSEQDLSEEDSDDLSSGVFSSCSTADGHSFNVDWSVSTDQTPSCFFEGLGVDIWVEDVSGESLKIRERPKVKIGHVAVGISEQLSLRTFSLATLDGRLVSPDTEVCESGMWLQCVPAPDGSLTWEWRVRDGKLELREFDEHPDTCSTVAL
ncbi:STE20-like serine/threonine-protein kinase [Carassius auratus]|uniref:STE20-like serine/threonine-protein kinase n=1 Tax=Carassius auratus TaxID=7957 RepID=A0A6P6P0A6_CARAU|nr:STE20-like serine/threonine-protein kinase [Carassius auratus]XP_026114245.1 STE20-like serine/threonine-protein kinase [Carassius auratus]